MSTLLSQFQLLKCWVCRKEVKVDIYWLLLFTSQTDVVTTSTYILHIFFSSFRPCHASRLSNWQTHTILCIASIQFGRRSKGVRPSSLNWFGQKNRVREKSKRSKPSKPSKPYALTWYMCNKLPNSPSWNSHRSSKAYHNSEK